MDGDLEAHKASSHLGDRCCGGPRGTTEVGTHRGVRGLAFSCGEQARVRAELERESAALLAAAQARGQQLEGMTVQVRQKAGVDGKLFGSVTPADITEALRKNDFPIERTMVRMPEGPLKTIGDFPVVVALHTDVHVSITVSVLAE